MSPDREMMRDRGTLVGEAVAVGGRRPEVGGWRRINAVAPNDSDRFRSSFRCAGCYRQAAQHS